MSKQLRKRVLSEFIIFIIFLYIVNTITLMYLIIWKFLNMHCMLFYKRLYSEGHRLFIRAFICFLKNILLYSLSLQG